MTEKLFVGGYAVRREEKLGSSPMRKLTGDESLRIRGTDLYKCSREGRETAPISLVITPLLSAVCPLAMEKKWMGQQSRAFVKVFI